MIDSRIARDERSPWPILLELACVLALALTCFGPVVFGGHKLAFRDTAHFFGPLHSQVRVAWHEGRLPLWTQAENGGSPLLGDPLAGVLYPPNLIEAALPVEWTPSLNVIFHVVLAYVSIRSLLRSLGVGWSGSAIGGVSYAFGGPVFFQHTNLVFLVGAAWAPLGLMAADSWLRGERRRGAIALAMVVAMQTLGGDLQAVYLTGLCAAAYAVLLACQPRRPLLFCVLMVVPAWWVFSARLGGPPFLVPSLFWGPLGVFLVIGRLRARVAAGLGRKVPVLILAALLGFALAGAQLVPVVETVAHSERWVAPDPHDTLDFSLEPYRLIEWVWPGAFGTVLEGGSHWLGALPPLGKHRVWVDTLYFGALGLVFALRGLSSNRNGPFEQWFQLIAVMGTLASLGLFTDPSAWAGGDGSGSFYALLTQALPGFGGFRYPSKVLVFVGLALSVLAGLAWDRSERGLVNWPIRWAWGLVGIGLAAILIVLVGRAPILGALRASPIAAGGPPFGPFDAEGAWRAMLGASAHGTVAAASLVCLFRLVRKRLRWAGPVALVLLSIDLAIVDSRQVFTLPKEEMTREPVLAANIREAEREGGLTGPVRVHRLGTWAPIGWGRTSSVERGRELVNWERDTLLPKYGLEADVRYTLGATSALESADFARCFRPFSIAIDERIATNISARPGQDVIAWPRRAFDLWGTRYFILPVDPGDWTQGARGFISFLEETEVVYPRRGSPRLPDVQVRRNSAAFPRAWTVHAWRSLPPDATEELSRLFRAGPLAKTDSEVDLRRTAFVEGDAPSPPTTNQDEVSDLTEELPKVTDEGPERVVVDVTLSQAGMVVLADRFAPGWRLAVDGREANVLKVNGAMRGAFVAHGQHRLVYTYDPLSWKVGVATSFLGCLGLFAAFGWARAQNGKTE